MEVCTNEVHLCHSTVISRNGVPESLHHPRHLQAVLGAGTKLTHIGQTQVEMKCGYYRELGLVRSGWVHSYSLFEPQRPPFFRTFDRVGFTHGRTKAVAANPACTGIPRCWNLLVSVRWYMLVCSLVPAHKVPTTVLLHQQSAFAVYFLHFAASSLLCLLFFSSRAHIQLPLQKLPRDTQALETSRVSSNVLLSYIMYT